MDNPAVEYAFDFERMQQAADNFYSHSTQRAKTLSALKAGKFDQVESPERLAKRANRLLSKVREASPAKAEEIKKIGVLGVKAKTEFKPGDINNELFERVLGATSDFLSLGFFEMALQVNKSVGRIVTQIAPGRVSYGTGFLVSPNLLLTNNHVLRNVEDAARSQVEFDYQQDRFGQYRVVQRFSLEPETFFLTDTELDFALVAVDMTSELGKTLEDYPYLPLIKDEGKIIVGEPINIIQHPRGQMKQIVVRNNRMLDLLDRFAHYEADTEPGSSGSPVFNDQWEVVALHHMGVPKKDTRGNFLDVNGKIWKKGDDPGLIAWVSNEGIRISRLVDFIGMANLEDHEEPLREELLSLGEAAEIPDGEPDSAEDHEKPGLQSKPFVRNPEAAIEVPGLQSSQVSSVIQVASGSVTLNIPLTITISLGTPQGARGAVGESALEKIEPDPNYAGRKGYDAEFLGIKVPMPKLSRRTYRQAYVVPGAPRAARYELKYHNYSVILNKKRRLAFVAAGNLDADPPAYYQRSGSDRWFFDPRLDASLQAGEELYSDNELDRGHLVRRADAAWGENEEESKLANDDTFHFTNCTPQHEIFNQSQLAARKSMLLWGGLENHIAKQAKSEKARVSIFNGPVFRGDDRQYRGVQIPREFFKVVVVENKPGEYAALAFLLSQESLIRDLPEEEFVVGPYQPYQVKIREIEKRTGLNFGRLNEIDPLELPGSESSLEAELGARLVANLEDILF